MTGGGRRGGGRAWALAVLALSAFLLVTMGGAIVAAPVTLPLLVVALRREALLARWRTAAVVVGGFTVSEVAWAATYVTLEEAQPWIWLVPVIAGAAGMAALVRAGTAAPGAAAPGTAPSEA